MQVSVGLPANLSGVLSKSSYGNSAVSKKVGRADKTGAGPCSIVGKSSGGDWNRRANPEWRKPMIRIEGIPIVAARLAAAVAYGTGRKTFEPAASASSAIPAIVSTTGAVPAFAAGKK
jgi:hypothetical protein